MTGQDISTSLAHVLPQTSVHDQQAPQFADGLWVYSPRMPSRMIMVLTLSSPVCSPKEVDGSFVYLSGRTFADTSGSDDVRADGGK
jgi:hypothetical protein